MRNAQQVLIDDAVVEILEVELSMITCCEAKQPQCVLML